MDAERLSLAEPRSEAELERYYDLRWRVLRAPWGQPRGSERDNYEDEAVHVILADTSGVPLAVGRLHFVSETEAQVRFMAVEPELRGRGLGARVLLELERRARDGGAGRIVLNARREVVAFYTKHGYEVIGEADTLFGTVEHVRMAKELQKSDG